MGLLANLGVKIAAKAATDTVVRVAARIARDRQKYGEGHKAGFGAGYQAGDREGYERGYREGYADARAGLPPRLK